MNFTLKNYNIIKNMKLRDLLKMKDFKITQDLIQYARLLRIIENEGTKKIHQNLIVLIKIHTHKFLPQKSKVHLSFSNHPDLFSRAQFPLQSFKN